MQRKIRLLVMLTIFFPFPFLCRFKEGIFFCFVCVDMFVFTGLDLGREQVVCFCLMV